MQGLKRLRLTVAVGTVLSAISSAYYARADVRPRYELLTSSPVLANGVLTFKYYEGVTVRILAEDGTEVPGRFIEPGIWRPDEPFLVGHYTADVSYEPAPDNAHDDTFEVIAAQEPNFAFIDIQVTAMVEAGDVVDEVCCTAGSAKAPSGTPCTANCRPLCLPLAYAAVQTVDVYWAADSDDVQADQTKISSPVETSAGQYVEGHWPVDGAPDELCGVAEVFSWLDESIQVLTKCIENPKPVLTPIASAVSSFGDITECTIPPSGYEEQWCFAQAYACEVQIQTLTVDAQHSMAQACEHYYDLCDRPSPVPVDHESSDPVVPNDGGSAVASDGSGGVKHGIDGPDGAQGCACVLGRAGTGRGHGLWIWAAGLFAWLRLSRRSGMRVLSACCPGWAAVTRPEPAEPPQTALSKRLTSSLAAGSASVRQATMTPAPT